MAGPVEHKRRAPEWLPWTIALLLLTVLALLDRRDPHETPTATTSQLPPN